MPSIKLHAVAWVAAFALAHGTPMAAAGVIHDEAIHGDLSGDRHAPTAHRLRVGINSVIATSVSGDLEYLALTLPAGLRLDALILTSYTGHDRTAFIAVQRGAAFTEPPGAPNVRNLLGWTHFGPDFNHVGTDILDDLGRGPGSIQFSPPLDAGIYTFWIQQTGRTPSIYQLDFITAPAPATLPALLAAAAVFLRRRGNQTNSARRLGSTDRCTGERSHDSKNRTM